MNTIIQWAIKNPGIVIPATIGLAGLILSIINTFHIRKTKTPRLEIEMLSGENNFYVKGRFSSSSPANNIIVMDVYIKNISVEVSNTIIGYDILLNKNKAKTPPSIFENHYLVAILNTPNSIDIPYRDCLSSSLPLEINSGVTLHKYILGYFNIELPSNHIDIRLIIYDNFNRKYENKLRIPIYKYPKEKNV